LRIASLSLTAFLIFCFIAVNALALVAFIFAFLPLAPADEVDALARLSSKLRMVRRNTGGRREEVLPGRGALRRASLSYSVSSRGQVMHEKKGEGKIPKGEGWEMRESELVVCTL
jgi:hypothetical protein